MHQTPSRRYAPARAQVMRVVMIKASRESIQDTFENAVDDYLDICAGKGKTRKNHTGAHSM